MFKHSDTKQFTNDFLADFARARARPRALVIDAESLMTSRSLGDVDITVLNSDPTICNKARALGLNTACGISTTALRQVRGNFDIIYLDYCGVPAKQPNGFDPAFDLLWAADHLVNDGIVLATFSRRFKHCIATAENLIPNSLQLAKTHVYFETSAMMCMFLVKENARALRDSVNRALVSGSKALEALKALEAPVKCKRKFTNGVSESVKGRKRKKRDFLMNDQASEWTKTKPKTNPKTKPKTKPKPKTKTKPKTKKMNVNDTVSVKWGNEILPGVVIKKIHGGYDIYFPLTCEKAVVRTNAVSAPVSNC